MAKNLRIGEVLLESGAITQEQLDEALKAQKADRSKKLGQHLIDLGFVSEETMLIALSEKLGYPVISIETYQVNVDAVAKIPVELAKKYSMIAIDFKDDGNTLVVATNDPLNFYGLEDIRLVTNLHIEINLALKKDISQAIDYYYSQVSSKEAAENINANADDFVINDEDIFNSEDDDTPVVKLLNSLLLRGYNEGASDIHIEPFEDEILIRMRIDGMLIDMMKLSIKVRDPLTVRAKILAGMDITEKRLPQDGHIIVTINNIKMNLRVSVVPTVHGEKIVMRYLNTNTPIDNGNTFGMDDKDYKKVVEMMNQPNGIIYVTGPTGSGKTTTLYLVMQSLAKRRINIETIEDPVEQQLDRINQVQVNNQAGMTFESGLRALLRQDPDIIMVGETRDAQTASISVRAAITGHLVVSTLHTNDAISTVVRLEDMGIEPYLVANSLVGVIAQRLVRKVCPYCGELVAASPEDQRIAKKKIDYVVKAKGCHMCNNTGYKGRVAVHEIIMFDHHLRKMINDRADNEEMLSYIRQNQDFRTLFDETLELVENKLTTIEELKRIVTTD